MTDLLDTMRQRHTTRGPYDHGRRVSEADVQKLLEAARWAPTAHNMQNFDLVVIDDPGRLEAIGAMPARVSPEFLRENYQQLSFSEEELVRKKTGILGTMFPESWKQPDALKGMVPERDSVRFLCDSLQGCPLLLLVVHDRRQRAPGSDGDVLGYISLGSVLQNMWLMAESLGLAFQVVSALAGDDVQDQVRPLLNLPPELDIAFACRIGYPAVAATPYLRVRRDIADFAHRNGYAAHPAPV